MSEAGQGSPLGPAALLDAIPHEVALLDDKGVIMTVNESWRRFASENGLVDPSYCVSVNYLEVCGNATGDAEPYARRVASGLREVLAGERTVIQVGYPCDSPSELRWFILKAAPIAVAVCSSCTSRWHTAPTPSSRLAGQSAPQLRRPSWLPPKLWPPPEVRESINLERRSFRRYRLLKAWLTPSGRTARKMLRAEEATLTRDA